MFLSRLLAHLGGSRQRSSLIRLVVASGAVRCGSLLASFLIGVQLARVLGVHAYGSYGIAISIVTLVSIPVEYGLPKLVVRETSSAEASHNWPAIFGVLKWANMTCWRVSGAVTILLTIGALLYRRVDFQLGTAVICGAPAITLFALTRIRGATLQGLHHVVSGQIPASLARPALFSLSIAATIFVGWHLDSAGAAAMYSASAGGALVISHLLLRKQLPKERTACLVRRPGWLASWIPLALTDGLYAVQSETLILLLGAVGAPDQVGLFRVASATGFMAAAPVAIIDIVTAPLIARLHARGENGPLQKLLTAASAAQFVGVVALSLPLMFWSGPLLQLLFGSDYAAASHPLHILLLGQIVNAGFGPNAALLNMTGLERRLTRAVAIALPMSLLLSLPMTFLWGATGTAVAMVSALLMWNFNAWNDARRMLGLETSIRGLITLKKARA